MASEYKLTEAQWKQLRALDGREPDSEDIPTAGGRPWNASRRPPKEAISIRLDADVLAWLRGQGPGYQSAINGYLRERMQVGENKPLVVSLEEWVKGRPHVVIEERPARDVRSTGRKFGEQTFHLAAAGVRKPAAVDRKSNAAVAAKSEKAAVVKVAAAPKRAAPGKAGGKGKSPSAPRQTPPK